MNNVVDVCECERRLNLKKKRILTVVDMPAKTDWLVQYTKLH